MLKEIILNHLYMNNKTKELYFVFDLLKVKDEKTRDWITKVHYRKINHNFNHTFERLEKDFLSRFTIKGN